MSTKINIYRGSSIPPLPWPTGETFDADELDVERYRALVQQVVQIATIIDSDTANTYDRIDSYLDGDHDDPYCVKLDHKEHGDRLKRCITNLLPLMQGAITQALCVDGFIQRGSMELERRLWDRWQDQHMDWLQGPVFDGVTRYGQAFIQIVPDDRPGREGKTRPRIHSPRRAAGLFHDPFDLRPAVFGSVTRHEDRVVMEVLVDDDIYEATYESLSGQWVPSKEDVHIRFVSKAQTSEPAVVRVVRTIDVNGRVRGLVEGLITQQDKVNQIVFDMLTAQASSAHATKWGAGVEQLFEREVELDETGTPIGYRDRLDEQTNQPIPVPIETSPGSFVTSASSDAKFGAFPATDLSGYHASLTMAIQHMAATAQVPPHHILGEINNLSAEALESARDSTKQLIEDIQRRVSESLELMLVVCDEMEGREPVDLADIETSWRDINDERFVAVADALGKLADAAKLHPHAIRRMIPGVTKTMLESWELLDEQASEDLDNMAALAQIIQGMPPQSEGDDSGNTDTQGTSGSSGRSNGSVQKDSASGGSSNGASN